MTRAPAFFIVSSTFLPRMPPPCATTSSTRVGCGEQREQVGLHLLGGVVQAGHDDRLDPAEERRAGVHLQGAGLVGGRLEADDLEVGLGHPGARDDPGHGALDEEILGAGDEHEGRGGRVGHGDTLPRGPDTAAPLGATASARAPRAGERQSKRAPEASVSSSWSSRAAMVALGQLEVVDELVELHARLGRVAQLLVLLVGPGVAGRDRAAGRLGDRGRSGDRRGCSVPSASARAPVSDRSAGSSTATGAGAIASSRASAASTMRLVGRRVEGRQRALEEAGVPRRHDAGVEEGDDAAVVGPPDEPPGALGEAQRRVGGGHRHEAVAAHPRDRLRTAPTPAGRPGAGTGCGR